MRYDMDEILNKAYKDDDCTVDTKPSHTLNQETISKMREQSRMDKRKLGFRLNKVAKLAVACCSVVIIAGVTTVAYSAIKEHYNSTIEMENGQKIELSAEIHYKDIPDVIFSVADGREEMQWDELEAVLGFSLLGIGDVDEEKVAFNKEFNEDGTVAVASFRIADFKSYGEPSYTEDGDAYYNSYISLMIDILDVDAEEGYIFAIAEGNDAAGEKELVEKYHSEVLDTEVIIYKSSIAMTANLIYDDVYYSLDGYGVTKEQMKETIEGLK